jgi:hypothetical protein
MWCRTPGPLKVNNKRGPGAATYNVTLLSSLGKKKEKSKPYHTTIYTIDYVHGIGNTPTIVSISAAKCKQEMHRRADTEVKG